MNREEETGPETDKPAGRKNVLRDIAAVLLVAACIAATWLAVSRGGFGDATPLRKNHFSILGYVLAIIAVPAFFGRGRVLAAIGAMLVVLLAIALTVDLTTMRFFGEAFLQVYKDMPIGGDEVPMDAAFGYVAAFVPPMLVALSVGAVVLALALSRLASNRILAFVFASALLPVSAAGVQALRAHNMDADPRIGALMREPLTHAELISPDHENRAVRLADAPAAMPQTVVLVVMESTGADMPDADGGGRLSDAIRSDSRAAGWVTFPHTMTSSNATDIAVPTILTGVAAYQPRATIGRLPFVTQYGKARGYRTEMTTSITLDWAGFEALLAGTDIDRITTAKESGLPYVNDLAVDDFYPFTQAAQAIRGADGPLMVVAYPHALHWPFQTESRLDVPAGLETRRQKAIAITRSGLREIFDALNATGRMEDALIVIVGDHGEFDYTGTLRVPRMRLHTFAEGVHSPILMVKAPGGNSSPAYRALAANRDRLVSNLDVVPSIAALLGGMPASGEGFAGYNLFAPVPEDRIVLASATNEWRAWPRTAIAVAQGDELLLCDRQTLCRLARNTGGAPEILRDAGPDDRLFRLAQDKRILREAMGQLYRGYYY